MFPDVFTQLIVTAINQTFFRTSLPQSEDCLTQDIYDTVVEAANCAHANNTLDSLRDTDYDTFVQATNSASPFLSYSSVAISYPPRPDGKVVVDSGEVLVQTGRYAAVPMLVGNQEDEGTLFSFTQSNLSDTNALVDYFSSIYYHGATKSQLRALIETYPDSIPSGSPFYTGSAAEVYPGFKRLAAIIGHVTFILARRVMLNDALKTNPSTPYGATWQAIIMALQFLEHSMALISFQRSLAQDTARLILKAPHPRLIRCILWHVYNHASASPEGTKLTSKARTMYESLPKDELLSADINDTWLCLSHAKLRQWPQRVLALTQRITLRSIEFHTGVDLHVKLMSYIFMVSSHLHFIVVESSISSLLRPLTFRAAQDNHVT